MLFNYFYIFACKKFKRYNPLPVKRNIAAIIFLLTIFFPVFSQNNAEKTPKKDSIRHVKAWNVTENLGIIKPVDPDTSAVNFQNTTTDHVYGIANAFGGNLGSPLEPKIYFDRVQKSDFLFLKPYNSYYKSVSDYKFYDTKTPFTNIAYYRGGPAFGREERFNALFSVNATSKLNVGFLADYIYGRGMYENQSTNYVTGGLFGSYLGKHYEAHGMVSINSFKNKENGGIQDERYVTDPQAMRDSIGGSFESIDIPVNLPDSTLSRLRNWTAFYNQKYHFGFERTNAQDSTKTDFIPVTTITHTIKFETDARSYVERYKTGNFYNNSFWNDSITNDTASYASLKNTLGISLNEEFNRIARFGLTAYASYDFREYRSLVDSTMHLSNINKNNLSVGGVLAKHLGERFKYDASGEISVLGDYVGDFNVIGNISNLFRLWKDTVVLSAQGFFDKKKPDYFLTYYQSNHYQWENSYDHHQYKTHLSGRLTIPRWRFNFNAGVENLSSYIYFDENGMPQEDNDNIQVLALDLRQDFAVGPFRLENRVIYQTSSKQEVLPLPALCLYHNLYFIKKFFKVLTVQLGVDVHYNTAYYAPLYMPATGQFQMQKKEKVGDYPVFNVYGNFHLKRMRFFVMYYHANYDISKPNYFSMTTYPINPSMFKLGLSWNFYD